MELETNSECGIGINVESESIQVWNRNQMKNDLIDCCRQGVNSSGKFGRLLGQEVRTAKFFSECYEAMHERDFSPTHFKFVRASRSEIRDVIIPSYRTVCEAINENNVQPTSDAIGSFLKPKKGRKDKWITVYKNLIDNPACFKYTLKPQGTCITPADFDFDMMIHWLGAFYQLRPIYDEVFAYHLLEALQNDGFTVHLDKMRCLGDNLDDCRVPFACSCGKFMHYGSCKHAMAFLFEQGLVSGWPPTRDPTPTSKSRRNQPARSRRGLWDGLGIH